MSGLMRNIGQCLYCVWCEGNAGFVKRSFPSDSVF